MENTPPKRRAQELMIYASGNIYDLRESSRPNHRPIQAAVKMRENAKERGANEDAKYWQEVIYELEKL